MFPLIPALILLLLHGPSNFERFAENGRLPAALAVFHRGVSETATQADSGREDVSRRALASLIAASGNRELSEAFASMFLAGDSRSTALAFTGTSLQQTTLPTFGESFAALREGFFRCVRSRDGPFAA
jgi:hypothetical protein